MQFLNPAFLYGFSALAIPLLIHLFNLRRYRKEYFTNVRFLSQIQLETRKRSRLKQLLVLAARLLALASLVLAFSQPFIPSPLQLNRKPGHQAISIYLDNSYSMEANGESGRLLDMAKKRAAGIVSSFHASDIFQLLTNDFEAKHSQFVNREEFLGMLRDVKISHTSVNLANVISRQSDFFIHQEKNSHISFLISDFQKSTTDFNNIKPDSSIHYLLVPLESTNPNNLFVDSLWFDTPVHRPGQAVKLIVRIKNCGDARIENIPLRLTINNIQKSVTSFSIAPSLSTEISLNYTEGKNGFQLGRLELTDYPVVYDDIFFFAYHITEEIRVLSIYGTTPDPNLLSLFSSDSVFNYHNCNLTQVDYGSFDKQNLILVSGINELASGLAGELKSFLEKGGSVCIFPPENTVNESYNTFFTSLGTSVMGKADTTRQRIASLDLENELFRDVFEKDVSGKISLPDNVDLPTVFKYYPFLGKPSRPSYVLMRLQNGLPFLSSTGIGKGQLYVCASPVQPAYTNFQQHLLFLPVMFKMAFLSSNQSSLYYIIGKNESIELPSDSVNEKNLVSIKKWNNSFEFIPELRSSGHSVQAFMHDQISESGWYLVFRGREQVSALGFNYDRLESDINCYSIKEIASELKRNNLSDFLIIKPSGIPFSKQVEQLNQGFPLWKWFIVLALIFIALEIIIIRFLRSF